MRRRRSSTTRTRDRPRLAAVPLDALVGVSGALDGVRRGELAPGDRLVVATKNSIYSLVLRDDGRFSVSGGYFERQAEGGARTLGVNGCTAGGHALFTDVVAAAGLFLEFGDGTKTTRICRVRHIPAAPAVAG